MSHLRHRDLHHRPPSLLRRMLGWLAVAAGLAMIVLPGPGLLALALGVILLGRRDPTLRRCAVLLRINLRHLSRARQRRVRLIGQWLWAHHRQARGFIREQVQRHAHGQPLSLWVRVWIGFTVVTGVVGIGASLFMLLF